MPVRAPWGDVVQYTCILGSGSLDQGEMALFGLKLPPGFEAVAMGVHAAGGGLYFLNCQFINVGLKKAKGTLSTDTKNEMMTSRFS